MTAGQGVRRARLRADVEVAGRLIGPQWPLERWVAVNPLTDLVPLGYDQAVAEARRWLGIRGYPTPALLAAAIDRGEVAERDLAAALAEVRVGGEDGHRPVAEAGAGQVPARTLAERHDRRHGTTLAAQLDDLLSARLPEVLVGTADEPLVRRWAQLLQHDRRARQLLGPTGLAAVERWPARPDDLLLEVQDRLGLQRAGWRDELRGHVARLPGWAAYARWCDGWAGPADAQPRLSLLELLALRAGLEVLVVPSAGHEPMPAPPAPVPADVQGAFALHALEHGVRRRLLAQLDRPVPPSAERPAAQVVCCIDVRSEGLRRHLEALGPYETFGFAGFFAAPVRHRELGAVEGVSSAPVLVRPELEVAEVAPSEGGQAADLEARRRGDRSVGWGALEQAVHHPSAAFPTAEVAGWALGPLGLLRTLAPGAGTRAGATPPTVLDLSGPSGPSVQDRASIVEAALRTMGLTSDLAPIVVLCGHTASSTANPHAAGLACGACGGNGGGPNARAVAVMANDPEVRRLLHERGLSLPDGTWFLAAEHDTTTDEVRLLDDPPVPAHLRADVQRLAADLDRAGARNAAERAPQLPDPAPRRIDARTSARRRAGDWAQTRPEWGLAGNAAMVVGPRALTRGLDLGGRAFLHSYDPDADHDGSVLETILTAPVVVAHWINSQYLFSSVDPEVLGAGDKTLHNPLLGIGVLEGASGDLRLGLPWQSVGNGTELHHQPVRLLVVLQAPRARVDEVLERNPSVRQLVDGRWIHLVAGPGPHDWRLRRAGRWVPALGPAATPAPCHAADDRLVGAS